MRTIFKTTLEFDAPPATVRSLLADPANWPALVAGLERTGSYWRYRAELYDIHTHQIDDALVIQAICLGSRRRTLVLKLCFVNTGITTRVVVNVVGEMPLLAWLRVQARFAQGATHAERELTALLPTNSSDDLAERYPHTVAAFTVMDALDHLERIARLDAVWEEMRDVRGQRSEGLKTQNSTLKTPLPSHTQHSTLKTQNTSYDLIYAGGGLGLLHAAVMARRYGRKVLLFDRGEVGCAHREWNISKPELAALVEIGLFTWEELNDVVMREYERGIVRFHSDTTASTDLWLPNVLTVALDAGLLLQLTRRKLEDAGGTVLDHRSFQGMCVNDDGSMLVEVTGPGSTIECYRARLLMDGMGSTSPLAIERFKGQPFSGVCPTVGTVVSGLEQGEAANQHNPQIGDILLSIDHAQRGQQYMWEGFPGRGDELTVYLFYYDAIGGLKGAAKATNVSPASTLRALAAPPQRTKDNGQPSLMQLFEDYFALLPDYKRPGPEFRHLKPVYGYIPARHSVRRQEAPLLRGVLPVGDSAAQQSPLTFCGFGSHVRNLDRTTSLLDAALERGLLEPQHLHTISAYQINVSLNWVFSRFMQPWGRADDVNTLQNIFLEVLNTLGIDLAERFFQDRMRWGDYHRMVLGMFFRHPAIVRDAWQVLGAAGCAQWAGDYVRYSGAALLAGGAQAIGVEGRTALATTLDRLRPAAGLRVRAAFAEWQAAGWVE